MNQVKITTGTNRVYKKNAPMLYQGEVPRSGFYLQQGVVKVFTYDADVNEVIVVLAKERSHFPLSWLFDKTNSANYYYEALTDCKVHTFDKRAFQEKIDSEPDFKQLIFDEVTSENNLLMLRVATMGQPRTRDKIFYTLFYLMEQFGKTRNEETYTINVNLTHSIFANLTGLSRETIALELNRQRREGIIDYTGKIYKVNKPKLINAIGEGNFIDLINRN